MSALLLLPFFLFRCFPFCLFTLPSLLLSRLPSLPPQPKRGDVIDDRMDGGEGKGRREKTEGQHEDETERGIRQLFHICTLSVGRDF